MEEDLATPDDSAKNGKSIKTDDKKEGIKDSVCKHFKEVSDQSTGLLYSDPQESSIEESVNPNKTDRKAFKKSSCKIQQGAVFSGKILSFGCSVCKDDITYSPNDLLKHFRGAHKETLPTYPCDLCGFVTNEFPALQRHRIGHRNTLVTCEICNDDVQYSLLLLTRHYIMCHSRNGHFHCEKCDFTTVDAGTFVQHIHHHNESCFKCVKCQHVSSSKDEHQKHLKVHSGTFPFTCQICGYGAARSEYLTKHMVHVHGEETERKSVWRPMEDGNNSPANAPARLKLLLKKSPPLVGESKWMSKLNSLPGNLPDKNGRLFNSERSLEETQQIVDRMAMKKECKNWSKIPHNKEQQSASQAVSSIPLTSQECENSSGSDTVSSSNPNGLTVLMVKNKISLPPNCTTKVMGFKMVDGKKHLVLKVIPTAKLESSTQKLSPIEDLGSAASDSTSDEGKDSAENGEHSSVDGSTSPHAAFSLRSGSCLQTCSLVTDQDDIMAIKVEEEETTISNLLPILQRDEVGENPNNAKDLSSKSSTFADTLCCMEKGSDHVGEKSNQNHSVSVNSGKTKLETNSISLTLSTDVTAPCDDKVNISSLVDLIDGVSDVSFPSKLVPEILLPVSKNIVETCGAADQCATMDMVVDFLIDTHNENSVASQNQPPQNGPEKTDRVGKEMSSPTAIHTNQLCKDAEHNTKRLSTNLVPQPESPSAISSDERETDACTENYSQKSPNQEVFNFHNYSKETFSLSSNATLPIDDSPELSTEDDFLCDKESSQWTLTLAESPQPSTGEGSGDATTAEESTVLPQQRHGEDMETVPDNDIEVDEYIDTVEDPPTEDENPESVLQDFNIIKIEEESIPVSEKQPESKSSSASLGRIVEEHSDAIISHQLEKERIGYSTASMDSLRPTKTTLRILQIPEGKQQMFLQTAESRYALPVQLKGNPGFKLITKSSGPQINVSYMKPGFERPSNPTGLALTLNSGRIGMSTPMAEAGEKGATLLSAVQPGVCATTSHYLVNSPGLKGPVLLSSTPHGTPSGKTVKTQPTCYLVQRPLPIVQAPSNAGFKLASTQAPLNSRPVLAMPLNSADKLTTLQTGRQAFLLRYVSSAKPGLLLNSSDGKTASQTGQTSESAANKVIFKIVRPPGGLLTSCAPTSASQQLFLAARPQTHCFLLSSNNPIANSSTGVNKLIPIQNAAQKPVKLSYLLPPQSNEQVQVKRQEGEKPHLVPRPIRPPSQRKRRRKALFDELPEPVQKARRFASKTLTEKETLVLWQPVAKDVERTLRLCPFSSLQQVKCPRRYQPVVVLNHPDADIPEVASIMKSVNRYRGAVTKVSLSRKTVQALSELSQIRAQGNGPRPCAVQSSIRERFLLKLKLKKKSKKRYEVVSALSDCTELPSTFDCWFCGRLFNSQEDWIGHGQRHLMEATRDWNKLF